MIARERGVKNYENLSKSRLIREINKLKPSKGLKKVISSKIATFKKYPKSFRLKKEKGSVKFKSKKERKRIIEIVKSLLSKKRKGKGCLRTNKD